MTKVAIIGGKLQGLEAVYLALKAGMETVVIDKKENVPASHLCHEFIRCDIFKREEKMMAALKEADFIVPALEDKDVLVALEELANQYHLLLAFDFKSYWITSSKILSDELFLKHHIPAPLHYPNCKSPYIVKPSSSSGSEGVKYIANKAEMEAYLSHISRDEEWVAQEFLSGRSFSIEVIGKPKNYRTYDVTEIFVDEVNDCKRVTVPCDLSQNSKNQFEEIAIKIAEILQLEGIMDVEVIEDQGVLKVLEIDARVPSQTPTVVYHCSGINLLEELRDIFCHGNFRQVATQGKKLVSFEHLLISDGKIKVQGEHIISEAGPLKLIRDFCGAEEALTDYEPGKTSWRGTFINTADTSQHLDAKRDNMIKQIRILQGEELEYCDLGPIYAYE